MEPVATPAAPAQPAESTPVTISATLDAANRGDFSAFDAADSAAKRGKPLPTVEHDEPAAPASAAPAERTLSKRQEEANDRTRKAVEAATADLRAELDRVKAQIATPAKSPEPVATPPAAKTPEWKRYAGMPGAPKLADKNADGSDVFESVEEHAAAMALFISETRDTERATDAQHRQTDESRAKFLTEHGQKYGERLAAAYAADPDIVKKIAPALMAARPLSGLSPAERQTATFANAVAETGLFSPNPAALYVYLSEHQDEAHAIAALPSEEHALRALAQLDGRLNAHAPAAEVPEIPPAAPRAAVPSTVTAAPPPVTTVSRAGSTADPQKAALARGDFGTFDRIEMDKKRAQRGVA